MNNVKSLLKIWPAFYHLLQEIYYALHRVVSTHILGTKMQEQIWRSKHIFEDKDFSVRYWESIRHPHRELLIERISSYLPFENILEIGCNAGHNLYLLSKQFPKARLYGIDINSKAISKGVEKFEEEKVNNVFLSVGKADRLGLFGDKSIDVVFTDAIVMCIGPDKINSVVNELVRIARKTVIFNEWHMCNKDLANARECIFHYGHWVYDYKLLLSRHCSRDGIRIVKIPKELWRGSTGWENFGYIVEASV